MRGEGGRFDAWVVGLLLASACGGGATPSAMAGSAGASPGRAGAASNSPAAGVAAAADARGGASAEPDGGPQLDAGPPGDAGLADAGPSGVAGEAGVPPDAQVDAGVPDAAAEPERGHVVFEVTTKPSGKSLYAPRNLLGIWVEDRAGTPLAVLGVWGASRRIALVRLNEQFPDLQGFNGDPTLLMDAVTGATLRDHGSRSVRWNLKDKTGATVPDGDYAIFVESTDSLQFTLVTSVPFTKGPEPQAVLVPESAEFGPMTLVYVPPAAP
jgi:hypothetical protein